MAGVQNLGGGPVYLTEELRSGTQVKAFPPGLTELSPAAVRGISRSPINRVFLTSGRVVLVGLDEPEVRTGPEAAEADPAPTAPSRPARPARRPKKKPTA